MTQQQSWQRQDWSYQQNMAGLQYGWQQEDVNRNIRFASGRERQQLLRQRNRNQVSYSMEEGQRGRERERGETQQEWQKADLARNKDHFEQLAVLQQEYFDMQRRHLGANYALQMAQLQAQEDHLGKIWKLEDDQRALRITYEDKQNEYRKTELEHALAMAVQQEAQFKLEQLWFDRNAAETKKYMDEIYAEYMDQGRLRTVTTDFFDFMISEFARAKKAMSSGGSGGSGGGGGGGQFTCNFSGCGQTFGSAAELAAHQSSVHAGVNAPPSVPGGPPPGNDDFAPGGNCRYCGSFFQYKTDLKNHEPNCPSKTVTQSVNTGNLFARVDANAQANRFTAVKNSGAGAQTIQVFLGGEDVSDLIAVRLVQNPAFEQGLDRMQRRKANRSL